MFITLLVLTWNFESAQLEERLCPRINPTACLVIIHNHNQMRDKFTKAFPSMILPGSKILYIDRRSMSHIESPSLCTRECVGGGM